MYIDFVACIKCYLFLKDLFDLWIFIILHSLGADRQMDDDGGLSILSTNQSAFGLGNGKDKAGISW